MQKLPPQPSHESRSGENNAYSQRYNTKQNLTTHNIQTLLFPAAVSADMDRAKRMNWQQNSNNSLRATTQAAIYKTYQIYQELVYKVAGIDLFRTTRKAHNKEDNIHQTRDDKTTILSETTTYTDRHKGRKKQVKPSKHVEHRN